MWYWQEIFLPLQSLGLRPTNITLTGCLSFGRGGGGYIDLNQILNTEIHLLPKSASNSEIKGVYVVTITCVVVFWVGINKSANSQLPISASITERLGYYVPLSAHTIPSDSLYTYAAIRFTLSWLEFCLSEY
jgi:hypothetical protein